MSNTMGPWADPRVTDTEMLVALARLDPDAAVGVLANPNLTDEDVTEVLSAAKLSYRNVDTSFTATAMMKARTAKQQAAIVLAAAQRSRPAARTLVRHMSAAGAHELLKHCLLSDTRCTKDLKSTILDSIISDTWSESLDPEVMDLYLAALPDLTPLGEIDRTYPKLATVAADTGRLEELVATFDMLQSQVLGRPPGSEYEVVHPLLLATLACPEVREQWAEEHEFGRRILKHANQARYHRRSADRLENDLQLADRRSDTFNVVSTLLALEAPSVYALSATFEVLQPHLVPQAVREQILKHVGPDGWLPVLSTRRVRLRYVRFRDFPTAAAEPVCVAPLSDVATAKSTARGLHPEAGTLVAFREGNLVQATLDYALLRLTTAEQWVAYLATAETSDNAADAVDAAVAQAPARDAGNRHQSLFGNPLDELV